MNTKTEEEDLDNLYVDKVVLEDQLQDLREEQAQERAAFVLEIQKLEQQYQQQLQRQQQQLQRQRQQLQYQQQQLQQQQHKPQQQQQEPQQQQQQQHKPQEQQHHKQQEPQQQQQQQKPQQQQRELQQQASPNVSVQSEAGPVRRKRPRSGRSVRLWRERQQTNRLRNISLLLLHEMTSMTRGNNVPRYRN